MAEPPALVLRPATPADCDLLLDWVNRPDCLAQKLLTTAPIAAADHAAWLARRLADAGTRLRIVVLEGTPAGQVRLQRDEGGHVVDIYVAAEARGRGVARAALAAAIAELRRDGAAEPVVAEVRAANQASHALFQSLGFVAVAADALRTRYQLKGDVAP